MVSLPCFVDATPPFFTSPFQEVGGSSTNDDDSFVSAPATVARSGNGSGPIRCARRDHMHTVYTPCKPGSRHVRVVDKWGAPLSTSKAVSIEEKEAAGDERRRHPTIRQKQPN